MSQAAGTVGTKVSREGQVLLAGAVQLHTEGVSRGGGQTEPWETLRLDLSEGMRMSKNDGIQNCISIAVKILMTLCEGVDGSEL